MSENVNTNPPLIRHCDDIYQLQCITSFYIDASTSILSKPEEIDEISVYGMELIGRQIKDRLQEIKEQSEALSSKINCA